MAQQDQGAQPNDGVSYGVNDPDAGLSAFGAPRISSTEEQPIQQQPVQQQPAQVPETKLIDQRSAAQKQKDEDDANMRAQIQYSAATYQKEGITAHSGLWEGVTSTLASK